MEIIKNFKQYNSIMIKRIFYIFMMMSLLFIPVNSANQEYIFNYEFEEGSGNVILDSSGNDHHLVANGLVWTTDNVNGNYAIDLDGNNDYAQGIVNLNNNSEITMSFWVKPLSNSKDAIFTFYHGANDLIFKVEVDPDAGGNNLRLVYNNELNSKVDFDIEGNNFNLNQFYHLSFSYSFQTNEFKYYRDGVLINTFSNINIISPIEPVIFRIGTSEILSNNNFDGLLDSFNTFNFIVNSTQINELYSSNSITLIVDETENNNSLSESILIDSFTPLNGTYPNTLQFDLNLLQKASCDFYLDNQLTYSFEDILSVSFTETLTDGDHKYFYYCSKLIDNVEYFEISQTAQFNIETPITQIVFQIEGTDFNVNDEELYITSPCPVEGFSAIGHVVGYQPKYNSEGIMWSKLENGLATVNISAQTHEFCLFNGRVIVNELDKTTNYNVQAKEGILELGNFTIPNNNYQIYNLKVDTFEIYDVYNPKAHGSSWPAFLSALLFALLGGLIMVGGIKGESKVMVLIGGTLLLGAFGLTLGGVISLIQL